MLELGFDYKTVVRNSEKVEWRLDDIFPESTRLDFSRVFLPPALAPTSSLTFLSESEHKTLNHICSNAYLNLFAFVEEYIIAMAVNHAHAEVFGNHDAIRALTRFADEEVKHQTLFLRYCAAFERDFGHKCDVLSAAADVAGVILSKAPLAVVITTLHLEIITQQHYTGAVKDDETVDPLFAKTLKAHWLEESQHARIDMLELQKLASQATPAVITKGFDDYIDLLAAFDGLLKSQADMDLTTFQRATGRTLTAEQGAALVAQCRHNYRNLFLTAGLSNRQFNDLLQQLDPAGAARVAAVAPQYA